MDNVLITIKLKGLLQNSQGQLVNPVDRLGLPLWPDLILVIVGGSDGGGHATVEGHQRRGACAPAPPCPTTKACQRGMCAALRSMAAQGEHARAEESKGRGGKGRVRCSFTLHVQRRLRLGRADGET